MERALRRIRASGAGAVTMERAALCAALALVAALAVAYGLRGPAAPMPAATEVVLIELDLTL